MNGPAVTFVIMAGGRGERLWPLVRAGYPKVCLEPDGHTSLLAATIQRLRLAWPAARRLVVTTRGQEQAVCDALSPAQRRHMLVEPQIRNTAACITLAAAVVAKQNPRGIMAVVPADHWIHWTSDNKRYRQSIRTAIRVAAAHDALVMVGIRPTEPHTGFGYLCTGDAIKGFGSSNVFRVIRFVEKPSRQEAVRLLRKRRTFWNSGTFVGTADTFLKYVRRYLPHHARRLIPLAGALRSPSFARRAAEAYRSVPAISFDHGIMDHVRDGLVVEGRFRWADLGSWDSWAEVNHTRPIGGIQSRNIRIIRHPKRHDLIAAIHVKDLLIIQGIDRTLICRCGKSQEVRTLVQQLSKRWGARHL